MLFSLCSVVTCTSVKIVDYVLTDLSVEEKSSNFWYQYVAENYSVSLYVPVFQDILYWGLKKNYVHCRKV